MDGFKTESTLFMQLISFDLWSRKFEIKKIFHSTFLQIEIESLLLQEMSFLEMNLKCTFCTEVCFVHTKTDVQAWLKYVVAVCWMLLFLNAMRSS